MTNDPFQKNLRRALQIAVGIGALVPVIAGLSGVIMGPGMIDAGTPASLAMDSHFRYLSGLLAGIGFGFWSTLPEIERKTERFLLLAVLVFIGGLGRFTSFLTAGAPDRGMLFGLCMELAVTPLLALSQYLVARRARMTERKK